MNLRVTTRANRDLVDIAEYIRAENPVAALRVLERIQRAFSLLESAPYIGRPSERSGLREFPVRDLPFLVIYRIVPDAVEVLTIFHTSRDPDAKV